MNVFISITESDSDKIKKVEFKNPEATKEDVEFFSEKYHKCVWGKIIQK